MGLGGLIIQATISRDDCGIQTGLLGVGSMMGLAYARLPHSCMNLSLMLNKLQCTDVSFHILTSAIPWERKKMMPLLRYWSSHHLGGGRSVSDLLDTDQQLASLDCVRRSPGGPSKRLLSLQSTRGRFR